MRELGRTRRRENKGRGVTARSRKEDKFRTRRATQIRLKSRETVLYNMNTELETWLMGRFNNIS